MNAAANRFAITEVALLKPQKAFQNTPGAGIAQTVQPDCKRFVARCIAEDNDGSCLIGHDKSGFVAV